MKPTKQRKQKSKWLLTLITGVLVLFVALQFYRPEIGHPPVTGEVKAPDDVQAILKRACYDCHSNETSLKWFDQPAPVYWLVAKDVREGRDGLNFSAWNDMAPPVQAAKWWGILNQVLLGAMPLKNYVAMHPEAKLSISDIAVLKKYVSAMSAKVAPDTAKDHAFADQVKNWLAEKESKTADNLPRALNGVAFIPDYKNWQAISSTERFDNGTMRIIYGNDVAIQAIADKQTNPWPKGTTFAKVAWDQLVDQDGNISAGAFKQVEFMVKDDNKYAETLGWGFARFLTPKRIPYGKTVLFATECVNCHRPMKDNDFVFTSPIKH